MEKKTNPKYCVTCNIPGSYAKACPGSQRYLVLQEAMLDDMLEGMYTIDARGCFVLKKSELKVVGNQAKAASAFEKLVRWFGRKNVKQSTL